MKTKVNSSYYLILSIMTIVSILGWAFSFSSNIIYPVFFAAMIILFSALLFGYERKIGKTYGAKIINSKRKVPTVLSAVAGAVTGLNSSKALANISFDNVYLWLFIVGILVFIIPITLMIAQDYNYYKSLELHELV